MAIFCGSDAGQNDANGDNQELTVGEIDALLADANNSSTTSSRLRGVELADNRVVQPVNLLNDSGVYQPSLLRRVNPQPYQDFYQPIPQNFQTGYQPGYQGSFQPTYQPGYQGSFQPTYQPGYQGSFQPTYQPGYQGSFQPTYQPGYQGSFQPTYQPYQGAFNQPVQGYYDRHHHFHPIQSAQPQYFNQPDYYGNNQPGYYGSFGNNGGILPFNLPFNNCTDQNQSSWGRIGTTLLTVLGGVLGSCLGRRHGYNYGSSYGYGSYGGGSGIMGMLGNLFGGNRHYYPTAYSYNRYQTGYTPSSFGS